VTDNIFEKKAAGGGLRDMMGLDDNNDEDAI
jgi:hypothetical protein